MFCLIKYFWWEVFYIILRLVIKLFNIDKECYKDKIIFYLVFLDCERVDLGLDF